MNYTSQSLDFVTYRNGRGISGVVEYYYASTSDKKDSANLPAKGSTDWETEISATDFNLTNKFLWNYETINYDDGINPTETEPAVIAVYSKDGNDGNGIVSIQEFYILTEIGQQPTSFPTGTNSNQLNGWSTTVPMPTQSTPMLWNYQITTYTKTDPITSGPNCIGYHGQDGQQGPKGDKGDQGTGVNVKASEDLCSEIGDSYIDPDGNLMILTSISPREFTNGGQIKGPKGDTTYFHTAYANSADGTIDFSTTNYINKEYIGHYTDTIETDSKDPSSYKWSKTKGEKGDPGIQGIQGPQGIQGVAGPKGDNGLTTYFHIKYSANSNGYPMTETPSTYIGTYVDYTEADSTDYTKYTWSRFEGAQGEQGSQGIPGKNGENGLTSYLHIAYATSADGKTGFSTTSSTDKTYIGQYTDHTADDSTDPTKYKWTKIKGEQGAQGVQGPQGPNGETFYTWIKYADSPTSGMSDNPAGKAYMGIAYNKTTKTESTKYSDYTWSLTKGEQGVQGPQGPNGETFYTWIKYADDASGSNMSDNPAGKIYMGIAYNKDTITESSDASDYTWSKFKGEDGSSIKKIDTYVRDFPYYAEGSYSWTGLKSGSETAFVDPGHSETWTANSPYDNSHIHIGDTAYLVGTVSDQFAADGIKQSITLYGKVTAVTSSDVTMTTTNVIWGGTQGDTGPQGGKGENAQDLNISASSYILPADSAGNIKAGSKITLTAHVMNLDASKIQWSTNNSTWTHTGSLTYEVTTTGTYYAKVNGTNFKDSVTIGKTIDGAKGGDAISITLTNPTMTFNSSTSGEQESCKVLVYEGSNRLTTGTGNSRFKVEKATSQGSNDSVKIKGDTITVTDQTSNGSYTVAVSVTDKNGKTISQTLTIYWTIVQNGTNGDTTYTIYAYYKTNEKNFKGIPSGVSSDYPTSEKTWSFIEPTDLSENWPYLYKAEGLKTVYGETGDVNIEWYDTVLAKAWNAVNVPYDNYADYLRFTNFDADGMHHTKDGRLYVTATALKVQGPDEKQPVFEARSDSDTVAIGGWTVSSNKIEKLNEAVMYTGNEDKYLEPGINDQKSPIRFAAGPYTKTVQQPTTHYSSKDYSMQMGPYDEFYMEYGDISQLSDFQPTNAKMYVSGYSEDSAGDIINDLEPIEAWIYTSHLQKDYITFNFIDQYYFYCIYEDDGTGDYQNVIYNWDDISNFYIDDNGDQRNADGKRVVQFSPSSDYLNIEITVYYSYKTYTEVVTSTPAPFYVLADGHLHAESADISGKITAKNGTIGGWNIGTNTIYRGGQGTTRDGVAIVGGSSNIAISLGYTKNTLDTGNLILYKNGLLKASNADIMGTIYAQKGSIGQWTIDENGGFYCNGEYPGAQTTTIYFNPMGYANIVTISGLRSNKWALTIGQNFGVTQTGQVGCTSLWIPGSATSGGHGIEFPFWDEYGTYKVNSRITYLVNEGLSLACFDNSLDGYAGGIKLNAVSDITLNASKDIKLKCGNGYNIYVNKQPQLSTSGSDERIKKSIEKLPIQYETLFDLLEPTRYKYIDGTSDRYHTGFIVQKVLSALEKSNLTTQDFAAVVLDRPGTENECWYLRRDEIVALNTWQIQKLKPRMTAAEAKILALENEITSLKSELKNLKSSQNSDII